MARDLAIDPLRVWALTEQDVSRDVSGANASVDRRQSDLEPATSRVPHEHGILHSGPGPLISGVVVGVLGAVLISAISLVVPARYESTAVAQVSLSGVAPNSPVGQSVTASNDLAAQYAQVLNSSPESASPSPDVTTTATVLANQNLIQISSRADSSPQARSGARAAVMKLQTDAAAQAEAGAQKYKTDLANLTAPLREEIDTARDDVTEASEAAQNADAEPGSPLLIELSNANDRLNSLLNQRSALQSEAALSAQTAGVSVSVIRDAGAGAKVAPKPITYGLVGGVLLGLVAFVVRRRQRFVAPAPGSAKSTRP